MIEKLNIKKFGSFSQFEWDSSVCNHKGEVADFKKLNILYGRNYSGKTTISRIFRSLENGVLPAKYDSPDFEVVTGAGSIGPAQISAPGLKVRVYNKDFVNENLRFLVDESGGISPFAIVGGENNEIERDIEENEARLGSVDSKSGLKFEHFVNEEKFESAKQRLENAKNSLDNKLREKIVRPGSGIKHNTQLFDAANYRLPRMKEDIKKVAATPALRLSEAQKDKREKLVKETALQDAAQLQFVPKIVALHSKAGELIGRVVKPSVAIKELLSDSALQAWVKDGLPLHRGKQETCGFCNSKLPSSFWERVDDHFNEASQTLGASIEETVAEIDAEVRTVANFTESAGRTLYAEFQGPFDEAKKNLEIELGLYKKLLSEFREKLLEKSNDIFGSNSLLPLTYEDSELFRSIEVANTTIRQSNDKTGSLTDDKKKAKSELLLNEVANFAIEIGYELEIAKISKLQDESITASEKFEKSKEQVQHIGSAIEQLRVQLHDESKGADKVNEILGKYFGHESLRLVAETDGEGIESSSASKFQIMRGDTPAFNLSEGECSLVAFCYFIAKLDLDSNPSNLIIFIDDPISSLDSNHVFFIYSLIESLIATPKVNASGEKIQVDGKSAYRYEQLFISTHNLEFLKYLKKLSPHKISKKKISLEQFHVVGGADGSQLKVMPNYLKHYVTEFNYLFSEICKCANPATSSQEHACFYNFGNNLRKFLEAFLYFKYPFSGHNGTADHNKRVAEFFKGEACDAVLVQRVINEYSHLAGSFYRCVEPIEDAETAKLARFVLKKIRDSDNRQYECLIASVQQDDPLVEASV